MGIPLTVDADLCFSAETPEGRRIAGTLHGSGRTLEVEVDHPGVLAGRSDRAAVRAVAATLAGHGLVVRVNSGGRALLELGAVRSSWWQRRMTGSPHLRATGARGAWIGARSSGRPAVLPDRALAPPPTLFPLAPTFLRRRRTVTTTHDPEQGGRPRLVLVPSGDPTEGRRRAYPLGERTTLGSDPACDIRLPGLAPLHAVVRHDDADEYVLVHVARGAVSRVNGEQVAQRILRTGTRVELGEWALSYQREEYADHGRPYGGRIGGELGRQRPQPAREQVVVRGSGGPG